MINARAETVATSGAFRTPFRRRRCLILADGFYEWKKEGTTKTPMRIGLKSWQPFGFAGLWDEWHGADGPLRSCTIITTEPNELLEPIHNRMPVDPAQRCSLHLVGPEHPRPRAAHPATDTLSD